MKKLSELSSGSTGKIAAINGDTHFQSRVTSIGLTIGCPFEVIQNPKSGLSWYMQEIRWLQLTKRNPTRSWWR